MRGMQLEAWNLFDFGPLYCSLKWIQKVKEETAFIIDSGSLILGTKAGWLHLKVTAKRPYADAAIESLTFQTWARMPWNHTWKVKDTKTAVEKLKEWFFIHRNSYYPLVVGHYLPLVVLVCWHDYVILWVHDETDSLNVVKSPGKVLE